MSSKRVVILGAGPAGLGAAWKLTEKGYQPDVIELKPYVGGMAHTMRKDGYLWDMGPHRFHTTNPAILNDVRDLVGDQLEERYRFTRVYFWKKFYQYPLNAGNLLKSLPIHEGILCFLDFAKTVLVNKIKPQPDDNFESWVVNRFGQRLYNIYFGPYTAKVWGRDPRKLSSSWAAQRVAVVDLWDLTLRTLGLRKGDNDFHHTEYKDLFYYPQEGVGAISEKMAERVTQGGGRIHFESRMKEIHHENGQVTKVIYEQNGELKEIECDYLISTVPVSLLVQSLRPLPAEEVIAAAKALKFRAMIFLMLQLDKEKVCDDHWTYFPDPKVIFNRTSEMRNFSKKAAPEGKGSLTVEITCDLGDEIWTMNEDELYQQSIDGLVASGLIKASEVNGHFFTRLAHAYPSYDLNYEANLAALAYHLSDYQNMITGGRQGLFRYINTDHALEMGFCAAQEIANSAIGTKVSKVGDAQVYFG